MKVTVTIEGEKVSMTLPHPRVRQLRKAGQDALADAKHARRELEEANKRAEDYRKKLEGLEAHHQLLFQGNEKICRLCAELLENRYKSNVLSVDEKFDELAELLEIPDAKTARERLKQNG